MKNNIFRHELKYRISNLVKDILMARLNCFLTRDVNASQGIYTIRSLYFDDRWNTAYEEKMMGIANRRKYRIRFYNYSDSVISWSVKISRVHTFIKSRHRYQHRKSAGYWQESIRF